MEENQNIQTNENTEKTYSEKEFQSEVDRRVSQALKKAEIKFNEQLAENEKLARMNEQEKLSYELDKREKNIAERETQLQLAENRATAIGILNEKRIDASLVDLVMADTAEVINQKIKLLEEAFNASVKSEVEKRIGGKAPKSSHSQSLSREDFSRMGLKQQQELANTNPDLYKILTNH